MLHCCSSPKEASPAPFPDALILLRSLLSVSTTPDHSATGRVRVLHREDATSAAATAPSKLPGGYERDYASPQLSQ